MTPTIWFQLMLFCLPLGWLMDRRRGLLLGLLGPIGNLISAIFWSRRRYKARQMVARGRQRKKRGSPFVDDAMVLGSALVDELDSGRIR